jgi:hypothetical protein
MAPPKPPEYPLVFPQNRARITQEPPPGKNPGDATKAHDADWSAGAKRSGGPLARLFWGTNPKQQQDLKSAG